MKKKRKRRSNSGRGKHKEKSSRLRRPGAISVYMGYYHPVFASYFKQLGDRINELRDIVAKSAIATFLTILNPPEEFSNLESIDILLSLRKALEDRIAAIASKHSIYYWIHLYRRLAPENTFQHQSLISVALYRETMETAFVKYGRLEIGSDLVKGVSVDPGEIMSGEAKRIQEEEFGITFNPPPGIYVKEFSINHFLELLSLERLVSEFCHVAACLRRAYKGGRLIIENAETYYVLNDDITEKLIQSYDERIERLHITATTRGVPIGTPYDYTKMDAICMLPRYNVQRETLGEYPQDLIWHVKFSEIVQSQSRSDLATNFTFMLIDMSVYYSRHKFISRVFAKEYGFSLECFVLCILCLFYVAIHKSVETRGLMGMELMQRAYIAYSSLQKIVDDMYPVINQLVEYNSIPQIGTYRPNEEQIRMFLEAFSLSTDQRQNIDLIVRGPRPLIMETWSGNYLLDYSALPSILLSALNFERAEWAEKGTVFEDYVIEELTTKGFKLWERQKILKARDGTQNEIDLSFLLGTAMFICECRSVSISRAFERGEKEALQFRRKKFESALKDADELAEWLSKRKQGANFEIPKYVNIIIPVAVSPFAEYIWSTDQALWLTKEISRVCTPHELSSITDRHILSEIANKPFVSYVP